MSESSTPPDLGSLDGRTVVLGVCGGIAAYKAVEVCRRLVDAGAHVVPVLTNGATRFVGETTFSALASEPVQTSLWNERDPIPHTRLGQSADLIVVAPATARLLSDLRTGRSADLLTATLVATRAPVILAPAMHTEMWEHPAIQDNLRVLRRRGVVQVGPEGGRLAGGDIGFGRLASPEAIVAACAETLASSGSMVGLHVVVTAGGTREPIDPVRFIGNRSSGKQGHAVAAEARARGARVTCITTVASGAPGGVDVVSVETAAEMQAATEKAAAEADVVVMAAAVADYRPAEAADHKLKKSDGGLAAVSLVETPDILAGLGRSKRPGQVLVGFAAETREVRANALAKLRSKGADLIVANDVSAPGVGFEHDTNEVVIHADDGTAIEIPLTDKRAVARAVLDAVLARRSPS